MQIVNERTILSEVTKTSSWKFFVAKAVSEKIN